MLVAVLRTLLPLAPDWESTPKAEDTIQSIRVGMENAFADSRAELTSSSPEVTKLTDEVTKGLTLMPLVPS